MFDLVNHPSGLPHWVLESADVQYEQKRQKVRIRVIWVPLISAGLLGIVLMVAHAWHEKKQRDTARIYRARFVQLVSQLDAITSMVNHLGTHAQRVRDSKVLDFYEKNLRMLETVLESVRRMPAFGSNPQHLDPAFFLAKDLRERVHRTQKAFKKVLTGGKVDLKDLMMPSKKSSGCYFCSRPFVANRFSKVRVKLDGDTKEVVSCRICRTELETTKKVKVLYFLKNDRPVHWSKMDNYTPTEDYWNINKKKTILREKKLELVYSKPESSN